MYYLIFLLAGVITGYFAHQFISKRRLDDAHRRARQIIDEALRSAETIKKEIAVQAKEEAYRRQIELEQEMKAQRAEIQRMEQRLMAREEKLDLRWSELERKEKKLIEQAKRLGAKNRELRQREDEIRALEEQHRRVLADISGLSPEEAKRLLMESMVEEARRDAMEMIRQIEEEARHNAEKRAKEILCYAMERYAADHVAETAITVVPLPNDEMKGRIIGRQGRNIQTLEAATGVEFIVDDTPDAIIISGFDPIRREIARIALERLIADGRIHPSRIEQAVARARVDVENIIMEEGERAVMELGIHGLHPELIRLVGRLKYRTSYGQNVLQHSKEVAFLAGVIASELEENDKLARRAGLIHDIGKAVDREIEGTHAQISASLAQRFGEPPVVVHAVEAHHDEVPPQSLLAVIIQVADKLSAARPGARRDSLEAYIKRLEKLERIAESFYGVEKSYAIQAGREIRVIVREDKIDDAGIHDLAKQIAQKVKSELEFPGQVQVTVIRETRAVEYAR
ncbi:TPA: ribonuclease Y [Candidatus Poribacteria bacterium]|nr:ribonuclease Y [Candidatus Poribacteria bacterium]